jgi:hypothetical protein
MNDFFSKPWLERAQLIERALAEVLAGMKHPATTAEIAQKVSAALGAYDKAKIANALVKLAAKHPLASQTGATFMLYGRQARGWIWKPGTDRPAPLESRSQPAALAAARAAYVAALADLEVWAGKSAANEAAWDAVFNILERHLSAHLILDIDPMS